MTPADKIRPLRRKQITKDIAFGVASLPLALLWLASLIAGAVGFLGDDIDVVLVVTIATVALGVVDAVLRYFGGRRDRAIYNAMLETLGSRLRRRADGIVLHVTDIRAGGAEVRACAADGSNRWYPLSSFDFESAAPADASRTRAELDSDIAAAGPALRSAAVRSLCLFATFVLSLVARDAVPVDANALATLGAVSMGIATAISTIVTGGRFTKLLGLLRDRNVGTTWRTGDDAVGECTDVWPFPETLTLRFQNGSSREYRKSDLVAA